MSIITREDGERFVIPSFREIITAKKTNQLSREIRTLTASYGEYITLQKKNLNQYEVALSPDAGFLLGECIWQHFQRPPDLVYCEKIADSNDAILVIVKSGSVYLDGTFPLDSIPDELAIFKTQENNFSIYLYGDVGISDRPEDGKFYFDPASVHDFTILDTPIFPTLAGVKAFQLQPIDAVLKSLGVGALPIKLILGIIVLLGLIWFTWNYISTHKRSLPNVIIGVVNPYQLYYDQLVTPAPSNQMQIISRYIRLLFTIPGWIPETLDYTPGPMGTSELKVGVKSLGARTDILVAWAVKNNAKLVIDTTGISLSFTPLAPKRPFSSTIYRLQNTTVSLVDRLSYVIRGNNLQLGPIEDKRTYSEQKFAINFTNISPLIFDLIGEQLANLPMVLTNVTVTFVGGNLSGSIALKALGN